MSEYSRGPWTYDTDRMVVLDDCGTILGKTQWAAARMDESALDANGRLMAASPELAVVCQKVRARAEEAAQALPGMTLERLLRAGDGVEIRLPVSIVAECIAALKKAGVKP